MWRYTTGDKKRDRSRDRGKRVKEGIMECKIKVEKERWRIVGIYVQGLS